MQVFDKNIRLFLISTALMGFSNGLFDAVYNFYLEEKGIGKGESGDIYGLAMLIMSLSVLPLIIASQKISSKKILMAGSIIYALPFWLLIYADTVTTCALTLGLVLSGMIIVLSTGNSIFGSHIDASNKTTLFSFFFVAYLGAAMLASIGVAFVINAEISSSSDTYRYALYIASASALYMVHIRYKSIQNLSVPNNSSTFNGMWKNMEWANIAALTSAAFLLGGSITLIFRYANILFQQAYNLGVGDISYILGLDKLVSIFGAIFIPAFVRKVNLKTAVIVIGTLTVATLYMQSMSLPLIIFVTLYLLRLLLNYALMPLLDTLTITGFNQSRTLISSSLRQLSFYLGSAASAVIYGRFLESGEWDKALLFSALLAGLGIVSMSFIKVAQQEPQPIKDSINNEQSESA
ncbi:MFS transporter [Aeromonas veronii]